MSRVVSRMARRLFLSKAGAGMAALGAASEMGASAALAQSGSTGGSSWQPARHAADDWLDDVPGTHRIFIDTVTPEGFGDAVLFANNYLDANKRSYGIDDGSLAVVICARHHSTAFAYSDAIWAKYGVTLAERDHFIDPKTSKPPVVNVYQASGYGQLLRNNGVTLDSILKRGVRLAVCQLATRARSALIARQTGGKADEVYQELVSNLVPNGRIVPAGIVAVSRSQERGYAFVCAG